MPIFTTAKNSDTMWSVKGKKGIKKSDYLGQQMSSKPVRVVLLTRSEAAVTSLGMPIKSHMIGSIVVTHMVSRRP